MTAMQHIFHPDGTVTLPWDPDPIVKRVKGYRTYYAGLDLGRSDPSALVIVEDRQLPIYQHGGVRGDQTLDRRKRTVVFFDAVLDTSYTAIADWVVQVLNRLPSRWVLSIDLSGLGAPFSSILDEAKVPHYGLVMTAGTTFNKLGGNKVSVSKNHLLETLAAGFEVGDLTIAADLPLKTRLQQEIAAFELALTAAGNLVLDGGGRGHHSDGAIATALAYWTSEYLDARQGFRAVKVPGMW